MPLTLRTNEHNYYLIAMKLVEEREIFEIKKKSKNFFCGKSNFLQKKNVSLNFFCYLHETKTE